MGNRRPKVLVVEDDDTVALGIHRNLYRGNSRYDVLLARSAEVGRSIMRELLVDVLVTDIWLPGMSGLDLAYWAAVESPETQFVLMTGMDVSTIGEQAKSLGYLRLISKPFEPAELKSIVDEALESRERLTGKLSALSAADLIQMLCLGQKTAAVRITANGVTGSVMVDRGKVIHAVWGEQVGPEAVYEIVGIQDGVFNMSPLPATTPTTINNDWQHLLMDSARYLDERARESASDPVSKPLLRVDDTMFGEIVAGDGWHLSHPPSDFPTLPAEGELERGRTSRDPQESAARLVDRGFAALRASNIELARRCWQAAQRLDPENRSIELNLKKLEGLAGR